MSKVSDEVLDKFTQAMEDNHILGKREARRKGLEAVLTPDKPKPRKETRK